MTFEEFKRKISVLYMNPNASVGDYIAYSRELALLTARAPSYMRELKIALLASFTIQGLDEVIKAQGIFHNVLARTYTAPYNQFTQQLVAPDSELYNFDPAATILLIDEKDIIDESHLIKVVQSFLQNSQGKLIVSNFIEGSRADILNKLLEKLTTENQRVIRFDFRKFLDGKKDIFWNTKYSALGDLRLTLAAFPSLAEALWGDLIAIAGVTKKCLVLDLDDTLWRGLAGEEGLAVVPNIKLQEHILELNHRGVILAINSKNNIDDAMAIIVNHPDMRLRKNNFAAWRINWQDKALNLRELATELKLGLDSFVFLDDSPFEQERVRAALPEVAVVTIDHFLTYPGFSATILTEEDGKRGQMYEEERQREQWRDSLGNVADFLQQLNLKVSVKPIVEADVARISQLTQKTNQFNLTTRRYTEENIRQQLGDGWRIWKLAAHDRFGDYGTVGVCIAHPLETGTWYIDSFLLSCRILGRGVERAFLAQVLRELKQQGAKRCLAEFIKTAKNQPCESFLADCQFQEAEHHAEVVSFEYNLDQGLFEIPSHIVLI